MDDENASQTHVENLGDQSKQLLDKRTEHSFQRKINTNEEPHTSKHAPGTVKPEEIPLISTSLKTSPDKPVHPENVDDVGLHQMAHAGDVEMMRAAINQLDPSVVKQQLNMKDGDGSTLLLYAANYRHVEMCKLLVEKGADINIRSGFGVSALHRLLYKPPDDTQNGPGIQLVEYLLDHGAHVDVKDNDGRTPLYYAARQGHVTCANLLIEKYKELNKVLDVGDYIDEEDKHGQTPLHVACWEGQTEMVRYLLQWKADVTHRSHDGWNALDFAIDYEHASCVRLIIQDEKWGKVLRNFSSDVNAKGTVETPLRKLIRKMPEIAEEVFTKCMEGDTKPVDHLFYGVKFEYEFLDDEFFCKNWVKDSNADQVYDLMGYVVKNAVPYSSDPILLKKNHPLNIMVEAKQKQLLCHPLVVILLNHKWRAYGWVVYYLNLMLYLIFMGIFNSYMLTMPPPYSIDSGNVTQSCVAIITEAQPTHGPCYNYNSWGIVAKYFIIVLSVINLIKEFYQIYLQKLSYFLSFTNLFEVSLYFLAILTVYSDKSSAGINFVGVREDWQWQVGAISIFLSWMVLIMFVRNMSTLGIFVLMFNHVLWTFMKFFVVFVLFLFGFALSFHCLLQNQYAFRQWWITVIKTLILVTGEFGFDEIFLAEVDAIETGADNHTVTVSTVNYRAVSYVLFVFFVFIMSIIVMNLLVGLAVDDIQAVQKNAELESLAAKVKLTLDVEYLLPQFVRRRVMQKNLYFHPNRYRARSRFVRWWNSDKNLDRLTINELFNTEKNEQDKIEKQVEFLDQKVESLDGKVESLDGKVESLDGKVESLDGKVESLDGKVESLDGKVESLDGKVDSLDGKVESLDGKVESLDGKVESLDGKVESLDGKVESLDGKVESLDGKVESLDGKVESLDQKVESLDQKVESLKDMMSAIVSHFNIDQDKN